jgi:hypothetical protein
VRRGGGGTSAVRKPHSIGGCKSKTLSRSAHQSAHYWCRWRIAEFCKQSIEGSAPRTCPQPAAKTVLVRIGPAATVWRQALQIPLSHLKCLRESIRTIRLVYLGQDLGQGFEPTVQVRYRVTDTTIDSFRSSHPLHSSHSPRRSMPFYIFR